MSRKRNVGAVMICTPVPMGTLTFINEPGVYEWKAGTDLAAYIYPTPTIHEVLESAWRHGAYDVRIIVDIPRDLRRSGSIVAFAGRPAINVSTLGDIATTEVSLDWGHVKQVQEEINWLIDACSADGHYHFSWRPNYGTDKVLRFRGRNLGLDEAGYRTKPMPELPGLDKALQRAATMAPADFVVHFSPPGVGRVEGIEWMESSHP
jgi:hypothetical protein